MILTRSWRYIGNLLTCYLLPLITHNVADSITVSISSNSSFQNIFPSIDKFKRLIPLNTCHAAFCLKIVRKYTAVFSYFLQ